MKNRLIIDWLSFSVRVEDNAKSRFKGVLNLGYICDLLGLELGDFSLIGKVPYYKECYKCEGISINVPFDGREGTQGYFITMTGSGCRYFEQIQLNTLFKTVDSVWKDFLNKVRSLTKEGLAVNIPRFDNAVDDVDGVLDINRIADSLSSGAVCTRFQRKAKIAGFSTCYEDESRLLSSYRHSILGTTVEFGSRKSRCLCRFYDKLAEQKQKNFSNPEEMEMLEKLNSWVRMEFEFKDESAIAMVNAFCDMDDYGEFFSQYVNGMIRFIKLDDSNISRCTVEPWWLEFLGTASKLSLSIGDYRPVSRARHMAYVYGKLSGVLYTALSIENSIDSFVENVCDFASRKLKPKHRSLCEGFEYNLEKMYSADFWEALRPRVCL